MSGICEGRVAIVTGAGRGLGRAHALELGREGASVVVNDLGVELDGSGGGPDWANEVAGEIRALGGHAVVDNSDISDWAGAQAVVERAVRAFGRLDVLVNNAGVLRDRMLVSLTADDVTKVVGVHLCGALFTSHHAGRYWRERAESRGDPGRAHHQHHLGSRPVRQRRAIGLQRSQSGHRGAHPGRRRGARPLRRHCQCAVARRPDPDDPGDLRFGHGRGGRRFRCHGARECRRPSSPGSPARSRAR